MSSIINLEKDVCERLYKESKDVLKISDKTEVLLDNKLVLDIFSRNIALYIYGNDKYPFEDNEFKKVITFVNNEKVELSVGTIKKNVNSDSTLVYGIID